MIAYNHTMDQLSADPEIWALASSPPAYRTVGYKFTKNGLALVRSPTGTDVRILLRHGRSDHYIRMLLCDHAAFGYITGTSNMENRET